MAIDVENIAEQMLGAALPILIEGGEKVKDFASTEFEKVVKRAVTIGEQLASGELKPEAAQALLQMQITSTQNVLLTIEGLSLIVIEEAINAALNVAKSTLNTVAGIVLIA